MPTYEYECPECGIFDVFQNMNDERLKRCPKCKRKVVRLLGTGAGVIFKGSGFYQTDYRNPAPGKKAKAEATDAAKATGEKPKPATETKPGAAKPAKKDGGKPKPS